MKRHVSVRVTVFRRKRWRERKNKADVAKCEHSRTLGETIQEYGFSLSLKLCQKNSPKPKSNKPCLGPRSGASPGPDLSQQLLGQMGFPGLEDGPRLAQSQHDGTSALQGEAAGQKRLGDGAPPSAVASLGLALTARSYVILICHDFPPNR